ncbi:hypothetical protein ID866_7764 [Astraeus odoratus]|nr:hypothetical protein ID866_7764 [Astraeus odoratus]
MPLDSKRKLDDDDDTLDDHVRKKSACQLIPTTDASVANLGPMLDFSSLSSIEQVKEQFDAVARELLCNSVLTVVHNDVEADYEIVELEFYLQKAGCHEDPFTHGSADQERSGQWYFHRSPCRADRNSAGLPVTAAGEYRSGSRKGLDLTLGAQLGALPSRVVTIRGGALLRTLRKCSNRKLVCGPSLLVDEILQASGASSISELVTNLWDNDISALARPARVRSTYMYLRPRGESTAPTWKVPPAVHRSPRIGLDLSHSETTATLTHPRVAFVGAPYRYFTRPELLTTKGRMQTFCGLYSALRESKGYAHNSVKLKQELCRLMGLKEQNVLKFLADYKAGYDTGTLQSFVGSAGKGVCQSSSSYVKMIGTLERSIERAHQMSNAT